MTSKTNTGTLEKLLEFEIMTSARLAKDLARLLEGQLNHDIVVRVGQGANTKEFSAHAGLLRARSPYFDVALSSRWTQADQSRPPSSKRRTSVRQPSESFFGIFTPDRLIGSRLTRIPSQ